MKGCSIEGCDRTHKAKGLCNKHYVRLQKYGSTDDRPERTVNTSECSIDGCTRIFHAKGYCLMHYKRFLYKGDPNKLLKASPGALKGKFCKVEGCDKPIISTKSMLCNKHNQRMTIHGTTSDSVLVNRRSLSIKKRLGLGSKVNKETGCWEWQRGLFTTGYGQISIQGKNVSTHRVAYEEYKGKIPEGLLVCHTCDNPICINPDHLWVGTVLDNAEDMVKKGRSLRGEKNHKHKLTEVQVRRIKRRLRGHENPMTIAKDYPVTTRAILAIAEGSSWKHVKI